MPDDDKRMQQLKDRIEYLHSENNKAQSEMRQLGQVTDPQAVRDLRFEVFINTVLGKTDESIERLEFEERFQEALYKALTNTLAAAKQEKAARKLYVPGRKNGHGGQQ